MKGEIMTQDQLQIRQPERAFLPAYRPEIIPIIPLDLVNSFLAGRSPRTMKAYAQDIGDFQAFIGVDTVGQAAEYLLSQGQGYANETAMRYRANMVDKGLSPNTINRRLTSIRRLCHFANLIGIIPWKLTIDNVRAEKYRDTAGPGEEGFKKMLKAIQGDGMKSVRDRAILRCLYDRALRRAEVAGLDVKDIDLDAGTVEVLRKGHRQKVKLTLPSETQVVIAAWLSIRGCDPGPLFISLHRGRKGITRLTGTSIYRMVRRLGVQVGISTRPHGLRHASITSALDRTGGDIRACQKFSGHRDVNTLFLYDDNRTDMAGDVAKLVASGAGS